GGNRAMIDEPAKPQPAHGDALASGATPASRARTRRRRERSLVLGTQILIALLLLAGMYALNAGAGKLTMPRPDDVLAQSIRMWSDGTMLRGLGESLIVLGLGFLLSAVTGIGIGILLGGFRFLGR